MRYWYFFGATILTLIIASCFFVLWKSNQEETDQKKTQALLLSEAHVERSNDRTIYTNNMLHFSFEVPLGTAIQHTVENWNEKENTYANYGIWFTDKTQPYRIFNVSIKKTSFPTIKEHMTQNDDYTKFNLEDRDASGITTIFAISAQNPTHPQSEDSRERHILFVRDGLFFDIVMRNIPTEYTDRVLESLKFLNNEGV